MNVVLVTGSDGFIGSHVCRAFHNAGWQVHGLDRQDINPGVHNFYHSFKLADYAEKGVVPQLLKKLKPDVIVHCAGTSLVGPSMKNPSEYYQNNVVKTIQFLDMIREAMPNNLPRILFSSSAGVYGNPKELPLSEESPVDPISPYGQSKLVIERLFEDYNRAYGLKSLCFRYFNAAGATPDDNLGQLIDATHIVARVVSARLRNQTFTLYGNDYATGDGTCVRDYIHVRDIADAHLKAVENYDIMDSEIFNLGTNFGFSNREIVNYVQQYHDGLKMEVGPRREGDPDILIADSTRARTCLRWEPKESNLQQIVEDVWEWYRKVLKG